MRVSDVMNTQRVASLRPEDDVALAFRMMGRLGVRHLPVVRNRRVEGVFSERDYLRYRAETGGTGQRDPVGRFMTAPAMTIAPEEPLATASAMMLGARVGCLPVVDDGQLVGILTTSDILAAEMGSPNTMVAGPDTPVARVMSPDPVTVRAYHPLLEAVALMAERGFRHVPVTDQDDRLVGMVSDRDVRTAVGDPATALQRELTELEDLRVSTVMTTPVETVGPDTPLAEVARRLTAEGIGALPVVDGESRILGVVSYVDVVRALLPISDGGLDLQRERTNKETGTCHSQRP